MKEDIKDLLSGLGSHGGVKSEAFSEITQVELPPDFVSAYSVLNGGEGFVGEAYLILWKVEELTGFNADYEVNKYAPGIFLFGSNGAGEGFGFDTRNKPYKIVEIPFVGMDLRYARPVANSFTEFLLKLKDSDGSLI